VISMPKKRKSDFISGLNTVGRVAFGLIVPIFVGFFLGDYLDKRFSTEPWLTLFFLMLGIVIGFAGLYKSLNS